MKIMDALKNMNPFYNVKKRADIWAKYLGKMGKGCELFYKVSFGSEPYLIDLGDNVKITYGCKLITHDGGIHVLRVLGKLPEAHVYGKIKIGNNVFLGNNVTILPGCYIGDNCIIGSGAVVTRSIPSNSVAAGVPAKLLSSIESYYDTVKEKAQYTSGLSSDAKKSFLLKALLDTPEKFIEK